MIKSVIVTGANGFTGRYLLRELLKKNYKVIGTYHKRLDDREIECQWYQIDLMNLEECERLVKTVQPDAIIHLAAQNNIVVSSEEPEETIKLNLVSTLNLLNAVRVHSTKTRCILAGTAAVYQPTSESMKLNENMTVNAMNMYAMTKSFQEQLAVLYKREYGLDIICTRPFNYTGYNQSERCFIPSLCRQVSDIAKKKRESVLRLGNLEVYRDFSDVRDVARAYVALLEDNVERGIYNIASGNAVCLADLVDYLCGKTDIKIEIVQDTSLLRKNDNAYLCGDNQKLRQSTGWNEQYNIYDTIDWIYEKMMEEE